jgi:hypothetical protein
MLRTYSRRNVARCGAAYSRLTPVASTATQTPANPATSMVLWNNDGMVPAMNAINAENSNAMVTDSRNSNFIDLLPSSSPGLAP